MTPAALGFHQATSASPEGRGRSRQGEARSASQAETAQNKFLGLILWHCLRASSGHMRFIKPWGLWVNPLNFTLHHLARGQLRQTLTGLLGNAAARRVWRLKGCRIFSAECLAACTTIEVMLSTLKVRVIERVTGRSSPCRKRICNQ